MSDQGAASGGGLSPGDVERELRGRGFTPDQVSGHDRQALQGLDLATLQQLLDIQRRLHDACTNCGPNVGIL
jgi:hypothetical protein